MHFSTYEFWVFFLLVWSLYTLAVTPVKRRIVLLAASYVFYASWGIELLLLLLATTTVSYVTGYFARKPNAPALRRLALCLSVFFHVGILVFFRYVTAFLQVFAQWSPVPVSTLSHMNDAILIPVGISFFTLQCMSYPFECYQGKVTQRPALLDYALFVAFFPQLLAGPIERASRLLPQFRICPSINWEDLRIGSERIALGLWQKLFIADTLSHLVNSVFTAPNASGPQIYVATACFAIQLYGDFAGYSNIARGTARLLGFELTLNFARPFLATNVADFWKRWHMTLYEWLRDFVFWPMTRSSRSHSRQILACFLAFFLVGVWHGSGWNFIVMGLYLGTLRAGFAAWQLYFPSKRKATPETALQIWAKRFWTFQAFLPAMLAFRADDLSHLMRLCRSLTVGWSQWLESTRELWIYLLPVATALLVVETVQEYRLRTKAKPLRQSIRHGLSAAGLATAILWSRGSAMPFIYFIF